MRGSKPGERRGGRQKGTPNKTTASAKEALAMAFEGIGGVPTLTAWAADNHQEFFKLWVKLVPIDVKADVEAVIKVMTGVPRSNAN